MRDAPGPHQLTRDQLEAFERDGFVPSLAILRPEEVLELRERVDHIRHNLGRYEARLYEVEAAYSAHPDEVICHFLGAWRIDEKLRDLVFDPRLTVPAAQLLQVTRLRFWHDQVFYKPPRHPGVVPWHQDYSYWTRTGPARHITINIMLDDADEESGCLQFVPGSQHWGLLPALPFDSPIDAIRAELSAEQASSFVPHLAPLPAGCASIHHSHTLHGSRANRSDRPRRALVFNYMCAETRVLDGSQPLLRHADSLEAGSLIEGELFPLVLE